MRAFPSRCHSGRARPHTWGDLPSRGRKAPDRSGIRRLPLLGNRPRPYPSRPQRHSSRAAGLARHGGNPPAGVMERPRHPRFTRHVHVAGRAYTPRGRPPKALLWRRGGASADCSTRPPVIHPPGTPPPTLKRRAGASSKPARLGFLSRQTVSLVGHRARSPVHTAHARAGVLAYALPHGVPLQVRRLGRVTRGVAPAAVRGGNAISNRIFGRVMAARKVRGPPSRVQNSGRNRKKNN